MVGIASEIHQQVELARGELNDPVSPPHGSGVGVNLQVTDPQHGWRLNPSQDSPEPRQEFLDLEWLGDVVVGPGVEVSDLVARGIPRRQHNHRNLLALGPEPGEHPLPVHGRKQDIEDHRVGPERLDRIQRAKPVVLDMHDDIAMLQFHLEQSRYRGVVFDDQDSGSLTDHVGACRPIDWAGAMGRVVHTGCFGRLIRQAMARPVRASADPTIPSRK